MNKIETFDKVILGGLALLVVIIPLFFLPLTTGFYDFNKQALLIGISFSLLTLFFFKMVFSHKVSFKLTSLDLGVLAVATSFVVSTIINSTNKTEALITPGSTGTLIGLTVLYFLITNNYSDRLKSLLLNSLIASALIISFTRIVFFLEFWGIFNLNLDSWLAQKTFSPTGSLLATATFLALGLLLVLERVYRHVKKGEDASFALLLFHSFTLLIILAGLITSIYPLFTFAKPILLPYNVGWAIAIEALKFTPLLGVGPEGFLNAFNQFRPIFFNTSLIWSARFMVSSNWFFHLLTTTGIIGLVSFLFIAWQVLRNRPAKLQYSYVAILLTILLFLVLPVNFVLLFAFYILLAIFAGSIGVKEYTEESKILPWLIFVPVLVVTGGIFYFGGRSYLGEVYFKKSLDALVQNQGTAAYNLQIQAIDYNPRQSDYRITYSQTNFVLANAIAQNKNLSEQDRADISTLIQQAIREAKVAVTLNPQNSVNWENLASVYRQLINFAQGADSWTIASYNQAIALDPTNPNLRLSLGGVYYSLARFDDAIRMFEQTVSLKPDLANGYYNLASAYREKGDLDRAIAVMDQTRSLIPQGSDDWKKTNDELEAMKKRLAEKLAPAKTQKETKKIVSESTTLSAPPQPLPEGIKPPLSLPTGTEPEIAPSFTVQPTPPATP